MFRLATRRLDCSVPGATPKLKNDTKEGYMRVRVKG